MSNYNSLPISLWPPGAQVLLTDLYLATDTTDIGPTHPSGVTKKYSIAQLLALFPGGFVWQQVPGTSQLVATGNGYITENVALTTFTVPATCPVGFSFEIEGMGAGGWVIQMGAGQTIRGGAVVSSSGGAVSSANQYDGCSVVCVTANTEFKVVYTTTAGLIYT